MYTDLATIERIESIIPHENADRLEIAKIKGWRSVVKKGEFKPGDLAIFIVIDSEVPKTEWSEFLFSSEKATKARIRTVKLRGIYSQGLVVPVSVLPGDISTFTEGMDVTELLNISKYEKIVGLNDGGKMDVMGGFPTHLINKTDEDNLLNYPNLWKELSSVDPLHLYVTLKLDGTSFTYVRYEQEYICTRNLRLKPETDNIYTSAAKSCMLIPEGYAIQAEIVGPGINKNPMGLEEHKLFVFNVFKIIDGRAELLSLDESSKLINSWNLTMVPYVLIKHIDPEKYRELDWWQEIANSQIYPNGSPAEGIVIRPYTPIKNNTTKSGYLSGKIINQNYGE